MPRSSILLSLALGAVWHWSLILGYADPIPVSMPQPGKQVSYAKQIADLLDAKCVGCHNEALAENRLILEDVPRMLKGGKRGPALAPGKADDSLLFKMAAHRFEPFMPPVEKKESKPLTSEELGLLKAWIDAGARDDSAETEQETRPAELGELPPGVQPVNAVDITSDGARIASGRANVVHVYDAESGLEIIALGGHKDIIQSIRFSPDGKRLAAGGYQIVTLWDAPTGQAGPVLAGHTAEVVATIHSPDRAHLVTASADKTIREWDAATGKQSRQIAQLPMPISSLAISRDGKFLAAGGSDGQIVLLNATDGKQAHLLKGHSGLVGGVEFLPDQKHVVSVSVDGTARIWTLPEPSKPIAEPLKISSPKGPFHAVAVLPDGKGIVTAGEDGAARLWNASDGKPIREFSGHQGPVLALAIAPDGASLITGSADQKIRSFDINSGKLVRQLDSHRKEVKALAFSPSGTRFVSVDGAGGIKVWETAGKGQGVIAFGHTPPASKKGPLQPLRSVDFLDEGRLVTGSTDTTARLWSFSGSWAERRPLGPHLDRVLAIDFHPDGTLIATAGGEPSRSGELKLWEVGKGMLVRSLDSLHSDTVFGVRFSPDGSLLASCAADKFLKITRVGSGKEIRSFEGHTHHVMAVDWKSDAKQLVTGGADNVLKVWDFETGEQVRTLQAAGKQVTSLRWVPGKAMVAGASGDGQVRFWNPDNGNIFRTFAGPSDYVFGVAVSADGSRVVAGGADSNLFLWNGENAQVLLKIEPPKSPDVPAAARTAAAAR